MNCSTLGFPVLHYLPKFSQTHVQWVGDAIQPSHPLSSPSPLALKFSQHRGLFQWVGSSHLWPFNPVLIDMLPEFTKIVSLCSPGFFQEINSSHLWPFNPVLIDMLPEFTKIVSLCSPGFFQEISSQTCDIRTSWLSNSPYPLIQHFFKILFYF